VTKIGKCSILLQSVNVRLFHTIEPYSSFGPINALHKTIRLSEEEDLQSSTDFMSRKILRSSANKMHLE
jgi:hypothetical protein